MWTSFNSSTRTEVLENYTVNTSDPASTIRREDLSWKIELPFTDSRLKLDDGEFATTDRNGG
jgi:hypothetical protein